MKLQPVLAWLAVAFVAFWVIKHPHDAQHAASNIGAFLTGALHGLSNFFSSI